MSRGSYLWRTANRAVQHEPAIVPPRRFARALPVTPPEGPQPIATPRPPVPANVPPPRAAEHVHQQQSVPAVATRNEELVAPEFPITPPIVNARPSRPRADFVFEASRRALSPTRNATEEIPGGMHAPPAATELLPMGAPFNTESIALEPSEPPRLIANARVSAPDPLAVALAAAVRWTSSDPAPIAASRSAHAASAAPLTSRESIVHSSREPPPPATPARAPVTPERAMRAPVIPAPETVLSSERHAPVPTLRAALAFTSHDPARATERFTGIHIGTVEVEILPSPDPVKPPVASTPAPPSVGASTQLARGLTSSIGLRQS